MLLIKNIKVIDGSGKPAFPTNVLIVGDKISAIGNFPNKQADQVIEGLGGYLTPGFIDVNTDADHQLTLFTNPSQENFLRQGVTTIIGGQCGSSLAPLLYGTLESIRKWGDVNQININWNSVEEFFEVFKKYRLGVNFGTLIGHSTIRRSLVGEEQRDLTENELKIFQQIIKDSMVTGAFGLSTGLGYIHGKQTPYQELATLVSVLNKYNGVYTTHLRDEQSGIYQAVTETLKLYKQTGVKTLISHFRPLKKFEKEFSAALDLIEKSGKNLDFHFDTYPFDTSIVPIYTLLPQRIQQGNLEAMLNKLESPTEAKSIIKEIPKWKDGDVIIAKSSTNKFLSDKVISSPNELIKIMIETKLKALVYYKNINYKLIQEVIFSDKALIASNSGGLGDRAIKTFTKFLELAANRKNYSIEKAINKITAKAAEKFSIKNRGLVKEGYYADLNLIINNQILYVIINGEIAIHKGELKNIYGGKLITRL